MNLAQIRTLVENVSVERGDTRQFNVGEPRATLEHRAAKRGRELLIRRERFEPRRVGEAVAVERQTGRTFKNGGQPRRVLRLERFRENYKGRSLLT